MLSNIAHSDFVDENWNQHRIVGLRRGAKQTPWMLTKVWPGSICRAGALIVR
jgi:hypothetical protein